LRGTGAEITQVTRQPVDWQHQAAPDLAEVRLAEAVRAFDKAGAITWTDNHASGLYRSRLSHEEWIRFGR
jgi:hypothetical protein